MKHLSFSPLLTGSRRSDTVSNLSAKRLKKRWRKRRGNGTGQSAADLCKIFPSKEKPGSSSLMGLAVSTVVDAMAMYVFGAETWCVLLTMHT